MFIAIIFCAILPAFFTIAFFLLIRECRALRDRLALRDRQIVTLHSHLDDAFDDARTYLSQLHETEDEVDRLTETTTAACAASRDDLHELVTLRDAHDAELVDLNLQLSDALSRIEDLEDLEDKLYPY